MSGQTSNSIDPSCEPSQTAATNTSAAENTVGSADALPLHYRSLIDISNDFCSGALRPSEVLETVLQRIATKNSELNAFLAVMHESARRQARQADVEIGEGHWRGPLHGVPIAVKDLCFTAGAPTTNGIPGSSAQQSCDDATVIKRLLESGAVLVGKLNMTEGASFFPHPGMPVPQNPWGRELWAGASSSGSGVATAAGLCFASLGSDTAGSIRVPSACNNLTGLRPTWGRISLHGIAPCAPQLDTVGPMARSAADVAAVLSAIDGNGRAEAAISGIKSEHYQAGLWNATSLAGVRIGVDRDFNRVGLDAETNGILEEAMEQLAILGAKLVDVRYPDGHNEALEFGGPLIASAIASSHREQYERDLTVYSEAFRQTIEFGRTVSGDMLERCQSAVERFKWNLEKLLSDVDILLLPVLPFGTPTCIEFLDLATNKIERLLNYTATISMAGVPALTLPAGFTASGRPVAMQFVAAAFADEALLRCGHVFQQSTDWHLRHPPT